MEPLRERGWAVVRQAVAPDEVVRLREAFDAVLPWRGATAGVVQLPGGRHAHPTLAAWARSPTLGRIARQALGVSEVQLLQDALVLKPPGGADSRIGWHRDYTYLAFLDRPRAVSVRLALDAESRSSGGLRVLEGSHRLEVSSATGVFGDVLRPDEDATLTEAAAAGTVTELALEPGDISVHLCLTAHGSWPNLSPSPRRTLVAHLFDAACRLDPTRLPNPEAAAWFPTDPDGRLSRVAFPVLSA
jgi:ectoine hydroxylase-related dioxygenase (phytanoyl-CoA dioxygenase family)